MLCFFAEVFPSKNIYSSLCIALRMHVCGATVIHIKTSFGKDYIQNPELNLQINWGGLTKPKVCFVS